MKFNGGYFMKTLLNKKVLFSFTLIIVLIIAIITILCTFNTTWASADTNTPYWSQVNKTNVTYNGEEYRVTLYEDKNFEEKQILFVSTPIYHENETASYTVTFTSSDSIDLSASLGVTISSEVTAFGNGLKTSLGIKGTISTSATIAEASHSVMDLEEKDKSGYWAVYGYNTYKHYKLYVEKKVQEQEYDGTEAVYGWKQKGCKKVWTVVGYKNKYKSVLKYRVENKYCGEIISKISNRQFDFDDMYLGSGN